jgi:glycosyltransferase involved in cell wall biosynthesis
VEPARAAGTEGIASATEIDHIVHAYPAVLDWGAHVVHDHTLAGPLYADRFRVPVVTTNHGPFDGELGEYYRAISATVPVIAISQHQAGTARRTPVAGIIHHGVDTADHPVGDGSGGYALFLGRMSPAKGVHIAARIARAAGIPLKIAAKRREPAEHSYFDDLVDALRRIGEIDRTQCRKVAEERFTAHRTATEHLALYHRVIGRPLQLPQGRGLARVPELHIVRS